MHQLTRGDSEILTYIEAHRMFASCRKVSVREFKGKQLIDIREYYEV